MAVTEQVGQASVDTYIVLFINIKLPLYFALLDNMATGGLVYQVNDLFTPFFFFLSLDPSVVILNVSFKGLSI